MQGKSCSVLLLLIFFLRLQYIVHMITYGIAETNFQIHAICLLRSKSILLLIFVN